MNLEQTMPSLALALRSVTGSIETQAGFGPFLGLVAFGGEAVCGSSVNLANCVTGTSSGMSGLGMAGSCCSDALS